MLLPLGLFLAAGIPLYQYASCGTALRDVKNNFEYLDSFEKIVLCLDGDEVGRKRPSLLLTCFKPGKCRHPYFARG
jgi:hypothetical protein